MCRIRLPKIISYVAIVFISISCQKEIRDSNKKIRDQGTSGLSDLRKFSSLAVKDALDLAKKPTELLKLANIGDKSYEGCQTAQEMVFSESYKRMQIYMMCVYEAIDFPIDTYGIYSEDLIYNNSKKLVRITPSGNDVILESCINGQQVDYMKVTKGSDGKAKTGVYHLDGRWDGKDWEIQTKFYRDAYTKVNDVIRHDFEDPADSHHSVQSETKEIVEFYTSREKTAIVARNYHNGLGNAIVARNHTTGLETTKGFYDQDYVVVSNTQSEFQADLKIEALELPRFFDYQSIERMTQYSTWDCRIPAGETAIENTLTADAQVKGQQCLVDLNVGAILEFPCNITETETGVPVTISESQKSNIADIADRELNVSTP